MCGSTVTSRDQDAFVIVPMRYKEREERLCSLQEEGFRIAFVLPAGLTFVFVKAPVCSKLDGIFTRYHPGRTWITGWGQAKSR